MGYDSEDGILLPAAPRQHSCERCKREDAKWKELAYLTDEHEFYICPDAVTGGLLNRLRNETKKWAVDEGLHLVCCDCAYELHTEVRKELNPTGITYRKPDGSLRMYWVNKARDSKRPARAKQFNVRQQHALKVLENSLCNDEVEVAEFRMMAQRVLLAETDKHFHKAKDWSTDLLHCVALLYACTHCWIVPSSAADWYRMYHLDPLSGEPIKDGSKKSVSGEWRCGNCAYKFNQNRDNPWRTLTIYGKRSFAYFFVGEVSQETQNKVNFLRGRSLLQELGSRPITPDTLMDAIVRMDARRAEKLAKVVQFDWYTAIDPRLQAGGKVPTCGDPRLCFHKIGQQFKAFKVEKDEALICTPEYLEEILDLIFLHLDLPSPEFQSKHGYTPSEKKIYKNMKKRQDQGKKQLLEICDIDQLPEPSFKWQWTNSEWEEWTTSQRGKSRRGQYQWTDEEWEAWNEGYELL